jgi:DNA-binding MarR family transcriptional regulator
MQCQSASRLPDGGVRGEEAGDLVGSHGPDTILAAVDKLTNEEVLDVLAGHQPVTLAELGRLLICEQGSPSRLVDSLVQRDLVSRAPHGQDRRAVLLELTAEGRDLAGRLGEATGRLTAAETETLVGLLRTLLASRVLSPVERTLGRMADELPIPDDLVQLQRDPDAASAALATHTQAKIAESRERYLTPSSITSCAPSPAAVSGGSGRPEAAAAPRCPAWDVVRVRARHGGVGGGRSAADSAPVLVQPPDAIRAEAGPAPARRRGGRQRPSCPSGSAGSSSGRT